MPGSFQIKLGLPIAPLIAACVSASAQTPCTPPDSIKAKFRGTPNPDALNDLGVWFGEQKNYNCAADAFATSLQLDPKQKDMPHIAFMFGGSLYLAGDAKEAIAALSEAEKFGYRYQDTLVAGRGARQHQRFRRCRSRVACRAGNRP